MRSSVIISVLACLLFLLAPSVRAADAQWPTKLGSWTAAPAIARNVADLTGLEMQIPFMTESGLLSAKRRTYLSGENSVDVTLYTFRDSSGAYEAYTNLQDAESPIKMSHVTIPRSNLVLDIWSQSELEPENLNAAANWAQAISDHVASPPIATYLPEQGRQPRSERYALGPKEFGAAGGGDPASYQTRDDMAALKDQIGFNSGAETICARYKSGRDQATLLLIEYPTPQLAELHLKHMQRAILGMKNGASVERKGSLLSIVLAPTSQDYAEKLRSAVNYETQVTWSEPSTTATDPPIMSTVVKIFIATGVFMVVTVVVGIAFGGVRIITKRLFPGKVFDRKDQIEVLQLGLSSKPIDPTDMY
jgi:hypothetical protein